MSSKARNLSDFISDPAIDSTELGDGSVTTAKLGDQAVTPAKLHNTLDLSSKTVTLATDGISGNSVHGGVISDFASTGIDDNASSTAVTIDSSGRVGVGTGSPSTILHLAGDASPTITFTSSSGPRSYIESNTVGSVGIAADESNTGTSSNINFRVDGAERMRIYDSGDIAIKGGNGSNNFYWDASDSYNSGQLKLGTGTGVSSEAMLAVSRNYGDITNPLVHFDITGNDGRVLRVSSDTARTDMQIFDVINNNGTAFAVRGDGNVGIGTASPQVKLEVNGGSDGSVVFGGRSDGGNGNNRRFNLIAYADGGGANYGGGLKIQTRDSVNVFHDRITVQSNGNVGIGTTSPQRRLHVANNGAQLRINREDGTDHTWEFYSWASGLNIYPVDEASTVYFGRDGQNTDVVLSNGSMSIGTTEIQPEKLHVSGNTAMTGNVHRQNSMYYGHWQNNYNAFSGNRSWQVLRYAAWYWGNGGFTIKVYKDGPYSFQYAEYQITGHTRTGYGPGVSKNILTQTGGFDPITVGSIVAIDGNYGYSEITIVDSEYNEYRVIITSPVLIQTSDNTPAANSIYLFPNNSFV